MPNKSGAAKSAKVICRSCGKEHEPIREFLSEDGWYVCSWKCLGVVIWEALYGQPCPQRLIEAVEIDEAAYWRSYRKTITET